jgi:predicted 2-oxoglutarate/Fe(II)-dependent dioxygenase YbiX
MSNLRPHISAKDNFFEFEDFDCFNNNACKFASRYKEWNKNRSICEIKTSNGVLELKNNPDQTQIDALLKISEPSLVGKGKETVMDEKVRKSREIKKDKIVLSEKFVKLLKREVIKLKKSLGVLTDITFLLHKITIYEKDSFFDEHMDAEHIENHIATLSIELETNYEGGELVVDKKNIDRAKEGCIQLTMFYTDTPHKINKMIEGYRISIQFDIVQTDNIDLSVYDELEPNITIKTKMSSYKSLIKKGIDKLKEHKVKKIGIPLIHTYFKTDNNELDKTSLKGNDRLMYELMTGHANKIEIHGIITNNGKIYREEILSIFKLNDAFKALYDKSYDEKEHVCESDKKNYDDYDDIELRYDEKNEFAAIKDEYLLGDCVFLNTSHKYKYLYEGKSHDYFSEINLGNEGFFGTIRNNLVMFVTLK